MHGEGTGRLAGKVALITGAASARAGRRRRCSSPGRQGRRDRPQRGGAQGAWGGRRSHAHAGRDRRGALARGGRRSRRRIWALDILVNSAGIEIFGNIETTTLAEWRKVNAVNAEGTFLGCREVVRAMKETGGSIVNLSSVAGVIGDASSLAYCASKGAVRLLTKSAALHCAHAGYKIRINSVHPSFAETPMVLDGIARASNPSGCARAWRAPRPWGAWAGRRRSPP